MIRRWIVGGFGIFALAAVAALAGSARAQGGAKAAAPAVIDLPETPAQLALGAGWKEEPAPALPAGADVVGPARVVALYREAAGPSPLALIVLRFDAPNPRAWRDKTRAAYLDEIEAGLYAACGEGSGCQGLKRVKRASGTSEAVPVMDLHTKDAAGTQRLYRFLFFRTYAILAAVELPAASRAGKRRRPAPASATVVARAKRALASFTVQANWQR